MRRQRVPFLKIYIRLPFVLLHHLDGQRLVFSYNERARVEGPLNNEWIEWTFDTIMNTVRDSVMFETQTDVKLHDSDAAGLLFFAHYFKMAHAAYESFMKSVGCGLHRIIEKSDFLLPIVHAEADYKKSLSYGEEVTIFSRAEVRESSFLLVYTFTDAEGNVAAELKTVHVSVEKETGKKIPLPEEVRTALLTMS